MKINVEAKGGVFLSSLKGGDTFALISKPKEIFMKLDLTATCHLKLVHRDDVRIAVVNCETGAVKGWLDCKVIPVATVLEGV